VLAALLVGCGGGEDGDGAVEVDAPSAEGAARQACEELITRLPYELAGHRARQTDPDDALAAAWGDPAIVLRCGVGMPEEFDRFSACNEIDGVGWFATDDELEDADEELTVTTIGWEPAVQVEVPAGHRPPHDVLAELAGPIRQSLTLEQPCA
jgi:hypothetical protein